MKKNLTRRQAMNLGAALFGAAVMPVRVSRAAGPQSRMGVTMASLAIGGRASRGTAAPGVPVFKDDVQILEYVQTLGGGGAQMGVGGWDADLARRLREKTEAGLYLEGQIGLPKTAAEVERFERQIGIAKTAGVRIFRTVTLGSRRYETFDSAESWKAFLDQSWKSLTLAEPVMKRQGVQLALENHKDWRIEELLKIIQKLDSEHVRICLDCGNNIALLEKPMEVIRALAPHAITTHLKDMAAAEAVDGFLLSEVPLGDGLLDLPEVIRLCRAAKPDIAFNLEMITRDPLRVPCLTDRYWVTFGELPARDLADTLRMIRQNPPVRPLPKTSGLSLADQVAFERQNIDRSFAFAREKLGI